MSSDTDSRTWLESSLPKRISSIAQDGAHVRVDGLHRIAEVAPALDHLVLQVVLAAQDPLVEDIVGVVVELVHRAAP